MLRERAYCTRLARHSPRARRVAADPVRLGRRRRRRRRSSARLRTGCVERVRRGRRRTPRSRHDRRRPSRSPSASCAARRPGTNRHPLRPLRRAAAQPARPLDHPALRADRARRSPLRARRGRRQRQLPAAAPRGLRARSGRARCRCTCASSWRARRRAAARAPLERLAGGRVTRRGLRRRVCDARMADPRTPALTSAASRGMVRGRRGRCAPPSATSTRGIYGGAVLNAVPRPPTRCSPPCCSGPGRPRCGPSCALGVRRRRPRPSARRGSALPPGAELIAAAGARAPSAPAAAARVLRPHRGRGAALDVNTRRASASRRTIVPAEARAALCACASRRASERARPGPTRSPRLLRRGSARRAPRRRTRGVTLAGPGALRARPMPALRLAAAALGRACGRAPALVRLGGSIPDRCSPCWPRAGSRRSSAGFALPAGRSSTPPTSRYRLESLAPRRSAAAGELYRELARLPTG